MTVVRGGRAHTDFRPQWGVDQRMQPLDTRFADGVRRWWVPWMRYIVLAALRQVSARRPVGDARTPAWPNMRGAGMRLGTRGYVGVGVPALAIRLLRRAAVLLAHGGPSSPLDGVADGGPGSSGSSSTGVEIGIAWIVPGLKPSVIARGGRGIRAD